MLKTLLDTLLGYTLLAKMVVGAYFFNRTNKLPKNKKGYLMIAWYLPPSVSSGVYRPLSFIKYAKKNKIDLSCVSGYLDENVFEAGKILQDKMPIDASIKRVKEIDIKLSWNFFPRIQMQHNSFLDAIAIYFESVKIYDQCPPKVIIATGPPFCDFIAATLLSKRYGSKLVLDYRDEWSESPFDFIGKNWVDRFCEKFCQKNANAVVFTTKSQMLHQLSVFNSLKKTKCYYVPNGWDQDFSAHHTLIEQKEHSDELIIISYIGFLGPHAKPGAFFDCISKIIEKNKGIKIKIRFSGYIHSESRKEINEFKYKEIIEETGHVTKMEALKYMAESTLLLLLTDNDMSRYRPGKLYDYLASKRPILVFGSDGEVSDVVCELNAGFYVQDGDWESLEDILLKSIKYSASAIIESWLAEHERETLAQSFFNIIATL